MRSNVFYLGIGLLFTHELDAIPNHEWQMLPLLQSLSDSFGEAVFVAAHVPIFAVVIACIASLDLKVRSMARDITSAFLVVHAVLHLALSGQSGHQFNSLLSSMLIYGAGLCGALYWLARQLETQRDA